ncbi:glutathionylspermidine synthase family protein [Peribacillus saganii]|uniref:Glutathionylspermidine synthase family protein n=1 Tax=Peribacillus saganii TaxID=2303992 RepID=A0A372LL06_9BACI|nr:glutathionylspermidine synthase family protein [Peribacillus saganii]RFU67280.1 glutathionylspermidine synthase family protein [Peribacillus saganii]
MDTHVKKRQEVYRHIPAFWPDLYGMEYALLDIKTESKQRILSLREAAQKAGAIFNKTAGLLRQLEDETLLELGYPNESLPFLKLKSLPTESVIARLDLVWTEYGWKVLELNADTPTFIKETFFVNEFICRYFQKINPNKGLQHEMAEAIQKAIFTALNSKGASGNPVIVFTSHEDHEEDRLTALFLLELSGLKANYIPLSLLRVVGEDVIVNGEITVPKGLYTPEGHKIDLLYRQTYPIEHLVEDEDPETKDKVGLLLLQLVKDGCLAMINPLSAFLLQSKAIMALIWGLHEERNTFFTEEEHHEIDSFFLPTYLDKDYFLEQGIKFVKKPSFGREGDTVEIYDENGCIKQEDAHKTYSGSLPVFQQFVPLPIHKITTVDGQKSAHIMYGCFLINGKASAVGIRAGGQITDNASYFLPVAIDDNEEDL